MEDPKIGISTQTLVSSTGDTHKARKVPQYVAALAVTLGAFALGNVLAWTSPAKKPLTEDNYDDSAQSWIGAAMALGAAVVVIPIGFLMDKFGRKWTMLGLVLPFVGGWLLIIFGNSLAMFIAGRFIVGMTGGAFSLTAPVYTSEIAEKDIRGQLGSFFQLMVTIGILFVYVLGSFMELMWLSVVCGLVPIVFGVIFFFMPETPVQHMRCGREAEARKSLQWFRGPDYDIDLEIREIKDAVEKAEREKLSFSEAFSTKAAKKAMLISMGLMLFQQLSGVNAVIFYAGQIFTDAGSSLDSDISAIIVGVVQVLATFVSSMVVDRLGRRILLLISDCVMAICSLLLGIFFYLKEDTKTDISAIGWLPLASLCIFIVVFSLGFGPIPWMIFGELFPSQIKGSASSVACLFNWILAFCVTKFFSDLSHAFGNGPTFWIFCGISTLGTVFVFFIVPETKGKSLEQIQRELGGESSELPSVSVNESQKKEWPSSNTEKY
ncbi:facilitated trehalose transporter Tret1 isoform X2 [Anabrus simplex]